jgi:hypothetical protein
VAWRFWEHRPRLAAEVRVPAPWGGLWGVEAYTERQPFAVIALPRAERTGALLRVSNWMTGTLQAGVGAGADRWEGIGAFGRVAGEARWVSAGDRLDARVNGGGWFGDAPFGQVQASVRARSSAALEGSVGVVTGGVQFTTVRTPRGMWPAGDTGHARTTLLRAHPVLDDGHLRADRLGRALVTVSAEGQRWWPVSGLLRLGAAAFVDVGRTSRTLTGVTLHDADAGIGARFAVTGIRGVFRADLARGLRDGTTVLSFVYELVPGSDPGTAHHRGLTPE